jgi:hypothetical protein
MATSHYFNNYSGVATNEQRMFEDVIVESIKIMGHNVWYVPRDAFNGEDFILGENPQSKFNRAYMIEMYLANVEGYEGDGDFFSKFGIEIRDTSNFVVTRRSFEKYVPSSTAIRPREGDLIFVPVLQKLFEIKFVEEELLFFSLGKRNPYIYELRCELFRYSNENISTGVEEIDHVQETVAYTIELNLTTRATGANIDYHIGETVYQGTDLIFATASAQVKDWDRANNKLYLINITGNFAETANVIGSSSNAAYYLASKDDIGDFTDYDLYDNRILQTEADGFIDFSEKNPFGEP